MAAPQELISHCEVVKEVDLKAVLNKTYKRKKAFKRLSHAEQDREGRVLIETGSGSAAAFFDLNSLRKTSSKRRHTRVGDTLEHQAVRHGSCACTSQHNHPCARIRLQRHSALCKSAVLEPPPPGLVVSRHQPAHRESLTFSCAAR